ncbi:hypothetical protein [Malaciobacter marinus]|jgi:hypothetical protein|uniref:hypothetical protein n=1 Tax=Malaciobacter marinus TaxID=505249 RepID=UPI0009A82A7E|nr:hypothetical protein [Malaciobacter marinus]SKB57018.1 hypothetical protein SAMN06295997_12059 [Malaciobacter marinus]
MNKLVKYILFTTTVAIAFTGCAQSSLNYTPPSNFSAEKIPTSKIVNKEYGKAWDELVNNLTDNSFVINNMSKDSGFINISFSASNPNTYVDCGRWTGYFKNLRGEATYNFSGAESARFTTMNGTTMINVESNKSLSGRANILLQKIETKKQKMKVNVKYVLTGTNKNMVVYPAQTHYQNWTVGFSSHEKGQTQMGQTQCQTTGILETELLNYIAD